MLDHITPVIKIPLTQGQSTIVDAEDADLAYLNWHASFDRCYSGGGKFTAQRNAPKGSGKHRTERLHRIILSRMLGRELARHEHADHINGNPLDNRRANLRAANHSENLRNRSKTASNTSGFKGVTWRKDRSRWRASIRVDGKGHFLGHFDTSIEAARAYDAAARELHGEFARLNFPNEIN